MSGIAAAERQNALLLDELTHRFKNDLANLTAILRLQAKDVSDPQARSQLMIASERVGVLSRLHERLTGSPKNTEVDSREFLSEVCNDLRVSAIGARPITILTELDPVELPFEAAISVGLIVNELVQNAIKYAFPGERPGTIQVTLRQMGDEAHAERLLTTVSAMHRVLAAAQALGSASWRRSRSSWEAAWRSGLERAE